ncbi:MAG: ATP synthase subunit I [Candidatus Omnitrophica bacterium]|nr:ATP synthase subunit I [Candidatus Omnitrophota bacterium]
MYKDLKIIHFAAGVITGFLAGFINFFIFEKQIKEFLTNKKWHLIIAGYIIRYAIIGIVFYFSVKKDTQLFIGVLLGFFLTQVIFFSKKAKAMRSEPKQ